MRLRLKLFRLTICLIAFFCIRLSAAESYEAVSLAKSLFAKHQFSEGQDALNTRLMADDLSDAERAEILGALGDFYCEYVGDYSEARAFYQRAGELQPDADGFNKKREDILTSGSKNADMDQIVQEIKGRGNWTVNGAGDAEKIRKLQQFIKKSPDYYRAAEAHYCIALYNAAEGRDVKALAGLKRAESIKPAISFCLPLQSQRDAIQARLNREIAVWSSFCTFIIMFLVSAALFFCAKPWRWLTFKTVGYFVVVPVVLLVAFLAVGGSLSDRYLNSEAVQKVVAGGEYYYYTSIYGPGRQIYATLLMYMTAAFFITSVFSLGSIALIHRKPVAIILNGLAGTLIMASLVCMFYLRHCESGTYETPDLHPGSFFNSSQAFQFLVKGEGIEPLMLTEPEDFPNPGISHGVNPPLEKWLKKHGVFSAAKQPDAQ